VYVQYALYTLVVPCQVYIVCCTNL